MNKITLLVDYRSCFGSRYDSKVYRNGMDKSLLKKYFKEHGFKVKFLSFFKINFREDHKGKIYLYTSSEDPGYLYKSYIEDIILGLTLKGAIVLPDYKYLRANNNKVFMEILRDISSNSAIKNIASNHFGTHDELINNFSELPDKTILKLSEGASSFGVFKAESHRELEKISKKVTKSRYVFDDLWDIGRSIKHKGYKRESINRKKVIVQNVIPDLDNDWKILIYDRKYYVMYRPVRKNDFRASGSGHDRYLYGNKTPIPDGLLDFCESIYKDMNVPNLSIDVAFDGKEFYLIEFQAIYFGSVCQRRSNCYHLKINKNWEMIKEKLDLEKVYADSIITYIKRNIFEKL